MKCGALTAAPPVAGSARASATGTAPTSAAIRLRPRSLPRATAERFTPDRPGGRGLVIAEGTVVVRRLIASGYPVRALLGTARRCDQLAGDLAAGTV